MFIILTATVAFGQNAYGPDFLNLHCTSPDPLAQTLFNIQPRSGLVPDRSANGNVVLYCDANTNTFKASFSGTAYTSLAKPIGIDVRDQGIDCTGVIDSTTAVQNMINNAADYSTFNFPPGCKVKITGTTAITIDQRIGLQFVFNGRNGNGCTASGSASAAQLLYTQAYAPGNRVLYVNRSQSLQFRNMTIVSNGGADVPLDIDQVGATPPINTRNDFENLCIYNNGVRNAAFIGIRISNTSTSNVENIHFYHPDITCSNQVPTSASSNGLGLNSPTSFNVKNEIVDDGRYTNCSIDANLGAGSDLSLINGLDSSSWTVASLSGFNDMLMGFRSENAAQAVSLSAVGPHLIIHDDFAASGGTIINAPSGCGQLTLISNEQDSQGTATLNCNGNGGSLIALNNRNANLSPVNPPGLVLGTVAANSVGSFSPFDYNWYSLPSLRLTPGAGGSSNLGSRTVSSPGLLFDTIAGAGQVYDHWLVQANQAGDSSASGYNIQYLGTFPNYIGLGGTVAGIKVGPESTNSAAFTPTVSTRGTPAGTSWAYLVQANTITGHSDCSAIASIGTGAATLNGTNFNVLQWDPYPAAISYTVFRTTAGGTPNTTGKIGTVQAYFQPGGGTVSSGLAFSDQGAAGDSSTCTAGNTTGIAQFATAIQATGTVATLAGTGACATRSGQLGGAWAGQVTCTAATAASTLTITTGATAANGWSCWANDVTHTLPGSQSALSTTAPVMNFTSVTASDVITFGCVAY